MLSVTPFVCFKTSEPLALGLPPPLPAKEKKNNRIGFLVKIHLLELSKLELYVGILLKKLLTYFEMFFEAQALHCVDGCFLCPRHKMAEWHIEFTLSVCVCLCLCIPESYLGHNLAVHYGI